VWGAFWTLHKGRVCGVSGVNPIQVSEIICYSNAFNMDIENLLFCVQILDNEYLKCIQDKHKGREKVK